MYYLIVLGSKIQKNTSLGRVGSFSKEAVFVASSRLLVLAKALGILCGVAVSLHVSASIDAWLSFSAFLGASFLLCLSPLIIRAANAVDEVLILL